MKFTRRHKLVHYLSLLVFLSMLLVACGGDDEDPPATDVPTPLPTTQPTPLPVPTLPSPVDLSDQPQSQRAFIWLVQGVAGLENVDIYLNDTLIVPRVIPGAVTSRALPVNAGTYNFRLVKAGVDVAEAEAILFEQEVEIAPEKTAILIATGTPEAIGASVIEQTLDPIAAGQARVVLINAASGIPAISLAAAGDTIVDGVETGAAGDEALLLEEDYEFEIAAGNNPIAQVTEQLRAGYAYTILLLNDATPGAFKTAILQGQTPPQTRVRLTHAAAGVPAVAIYLDDEQALTVGITYAETLPFETIASRSYRARVVVIEGDQNGEELLSTNIAFLPNKTVDIVLMGELDSVRLGQFDINTEAVASDRTRLTVVNAIPNETQARVMTVNNREVQAQIPFGRSSNPIELNLTQNDLYFMGGPLDESRVLEDPPPFNFEAGKVYTYILTVAAFGQAELLSLDVGVSGDAQIVGDDGEDGASVPDEAEVQVVNALDTATTVDVFLNDTRLVEDLAQATISDRLTMDSGVYQLRVQVDGGDVIYEREVVIDAEESPSITVFIMGATDNVDVLANPDFDGLVNLASAQIRFVHANSNGSNLLVFIPTVGEGTPPAEGDSGQIPVYSNLEPLFVGSVVEIPAGTMPIAGLGSQTGQVEFTSEFITLEGGEFYDILLLPGLDGVGWRTVVIPRPRE